MRIDDVPAVRRQLGARRRAGDRQLQRHTGALRQVDEAAEFDVLGAIPRLHRSPAARSPRFQDITVVNRGAAASKVNGQRSRTTGGRVGFHSRPHAGTRQSGGADVLGEGEEALVRRG